MVNLNGLMLNLKKTNYMIFHDFKIGGTKIKLQPEFISLGVIVDKKLTDMILSYLVWSHHRYCHSQVQNV